MRAVRRFGWLVFGLAPTLLLALVLPLTAAATIVLDHDILGRDAEGWPVLYRVPVLRHAVDALHFAAMFAAPPTLASWFLAMGRRADTSTAWIVAGGLLVCIAGSVPVIEAVWTGVKGTSGLHIGLANTAAFAVRLTNNLAIYGAALFLLRDDTRTRR